MTAELERPDRKASSIASKLRDWGSLQLLAVKYAGDWERVQKDTEFTTCVRDSQKPRVERLCGLTRAMHALPSTRQALTHFYDNLVANYAISFKAHAEDVRADYYTQFVEKYMRLLLGEH